jgi:diacylglycerol kinase family enzyme
MRAAIIINPAKSEVGAREQIDGTLTAAGWSPSLWLETTPEDPGRGMAEAAVAATVQLIVICGGDGTVMACLSGLADSGVPVAIIPVGSGNLQPFAVMAGMGFDAAMMADTSEGMKRFAGWPAYVVSGLRHLRDPVMQVRICIDDGPMLRRSARTVLVGNVGQLEGGIELLPDAAADDGLLDVAVVAPRTLRDWLRVAYRIARHRRHDRHLERFTGRTISIEADRVVPRQIDGEVIDEGRRIDVHVEPGALVVRVPQSAAAAA